jgi:3-hydroxybutyryl-CoA dehydrogenase
MKRLQLLSRSDLRMAERFVVVGGGTMGVGIALVGALNGYDVEIVEPDAGARERGGAYAEREISKADEGPARGRIHWLERIATPLDAVLAIEAVPERFDLKRDVLIELARAVSPQSVIATNTSSLSVGELADSIEHPQRVVGLHFFNPPAKMKLLEIVSGPQTSEDTLDRAFEFAESIGKTPVLASDTPGFIVNRVARPYYLQALRALERGVASAEELDALARGVGFRMGPFELMDFIGLDVNLATTESVYQRTEARRFAPVEQQRRMVAQGLLGRKRGEGFYSYRAGNPERFEPIVAVPAEETCEEESVALLGFGDRADAFSELLARRYPRFMRIENDELLDELSSACTIVLDVGDGYTDRCEVIEQLDRRLDAQSVFFVDAYATDIDACARRMRHPQRLVGYGILASVNGQDHVEIVDSEVVADDALELAQEFFGALGKGVVLVENVPGFFLGRTVGSIVNEALVAVAEDVASPEDVDTAMCLGANYPIGPIAWGREIGGSRIRRILKRLADSEGHEFAPHRSLWMLDLAETPAEEEATQ